jgi:squalene-hopene/tetraprenyl-beta-curcumene cyclase
MKIHLTVAWSLLFTVISLAAAEDAQKQADILGVNDLAHAPIPTRKKPAFQYESDGIAIPLPTADEPKAQFGPESLKAAVDYMEQGALSWVREKSCINCHTTGPYMAERPYLNAYYGLPNKEVWEDFASDIPVGKKPKPTVKHGKEHVSGGFISVWRALGLAEWDRLVEHKLSPETEKALQDMLNRQMPNGAFATVGEAEIPYITTDFELTVQAVRTMAVAPGWLAGQTDPAVLQQVEKMKQYMRGEKFKNDYDRLLRLQVEPLMPDVFSDSEVAESLALLSSRQHEDGGWSLRDMSAPEDWSFNMTPEILGIFKKLPDAAKPESDPYMTAFAIVLMRELGIAKEDPRIQKGLAWLKREQRISGRWWMHSLYRETYHYITYIATAQAMKAFALCDVLPRAQGGS